LNITPHPGRVKRGECVVVHFPIIRISVIIVPPFLWIALTGIVSIMLAFLTVFGLSFLTALSGALQPGPLLTYTIVQTLKAPRRGWLTGPLVIAGHAVIELLLIIGLLLGLSALLTNELTVRIIGTAGACFLILLTLLTLRDVFIKKVSLPNCDNLKTNGGRGVMRLPWMGGALVSMSNPFWWIWWATLGFFFMRQYDVTLQNPPLLLAFFLGHEAGDLGWYTLVSVMTHIGKRWISRTVYHVILIVIAAALVGFAAFLVYSTYRYQG
jgi:threonine/homoserine/homoserine lactone efflux protein